MRAESGDVGCTESTNFFFDCWDLQIVTNNGIWDIPWCSGYHSKGFRLKAFEDFSIGGGGSAPQLDAVCPDMFDGYFINKQLIA
jgi:hypothetical protein